MDLRHGHDPTLWPFACHRAALVPVCLALAGTRPALGPALAAANALAAWALLRAASRPTPRPAAWRLVLPWVLWLACWMEAGWLIGLAGQPPHDAAIAAADRAVFGVAWHRQLSVLLPGAGLREAMHAVYLSYYALVLTPPLVLALRGRRGDCARYAGVVTATYLVCFLAYVIHPVLGPRAVEAVAGGGAAAGPFSGLAEALRAAGDARGTAFPSSHCAGALAAALAAGAVSSPRLRAALIGWALLVAVATVHTGNHYALDSAVGLLLAVGVRLALVRGPARGAAVCERSPT